MKYRISLLVALIFPFVLYGETTSDVDSLQKHFVEVLSTSQQKSLKQIFSEFPIKVPLESRKATEEALASTQYIYDTFMSKSGSFVYCEPIGILSLGTRIKRFGFFVKLEKGTAFWEIYCYKRDVCWELVNFNWQLKGDANELLKLIPIEYWKKD